MGRVAATVAELGDGRFPGEVGIIQVASGRRVSLEWLEALRVWVGTPETTMRQADGAGMVAGGDPTLWTYPFRTEGLPTIDTGFGFQIHWIRDADLLWEAGLRLQQNLTAVLRAGAGGTPVLALNFYDLEAGDAFLSPPPTNFGLQLQGPTDTVADHLATTGWQNYPGVAPSKSWYPELYCKGSGGFPFRRFHAQHRWVAGNIGALGGGETPDLPPLFSSAFVWCEAREIAKVDQAVVDNWTDYSGRGNHFAGFGGVKLRRGVAGDQPAFVTFDGIDDALRCVKSGGYAAPGVSFLVLRQRAGGAVQQMWLDAATLLYRGDDVDQVNAWMGAGADLVYHRPAVWPSPWMVVSVKSNGASSNVWEGKALKVSGNAGARGWGDFTIGSNIGGALFARIDVAAFYNVAADVSNVDRSAIIDWLGARYGIAV